MGIFLTNQPTKIGLVQVGFLAGPIVRGASSNGDDAGFVSGHNRGRQIAHGQRQGVTRRVMRFGVLQHAQLLLGAAVHPLGDLERARAKEEEEEEQRDDDVTGVFWRRRRRWRRRRFRGGIGPFGAKMVGGVC